jgi:hypothetical protein
MGKENKRTEEEAKGELREEAEENERETMRARRES